MNQNEHDESLDQIAHSLAANVATNPGENPGEMKITLGGFYYRMSLSIGARSRQ